MASADFCAFSTAFGSGYVFQRLPHRPPWVPHVSFTPSTCLIYPMRFRVAIGLYLVSQTYPRMRPYMRFLFVRPELCPRVSIFPESSFLQILPRDRHPCLRLCPSRYRADSGLTPVRNVRRQAHDRKTGRTRGGPDRSCDFQKSIWKRAMPTALHHHFADLFTSDPTAASLRLRVPDDMYVRRCSGSPSAP